VGDISVRAGVTADDQVWLESLWRESWGDVIVVSRGRIHCLLDLPTLIARDGMERVGAATYHLDGDIAELTSLNAVVTGRGVGSVLLAAVEAAPRALGV
jgi:N-acetylglutamate synthase-like GNAT family acetyltransferase